MTDQPTTFDELLAAEQAARQEWARGLVVRCGSIAAAARTARMDRSNFKRLLKNGNRSGRRRRDTGVPRLRQEVACG